MIYFRLFYSFEGLKYFPNQFREQLVFGNIFII